MTDPTSATFRGTTSSTGDIPLCEEMKELNDLHRIRNLFVKFKPQFPDLRGDLDQWLKHLTNSESDFTKGNQYPPLNALSFAVLVDYEILEKLNDKLMKQEHVNEGVELCKIIFAGYTGFFGSDHQRTLQAQLKLHLYLFNMQEYAQALDLNRQVYEILQSSNFGPNHELTMVVQQNVASIFMHQDKCEEATQLLRSVYDRRIYFLGKEHPVTHKTRAQIDSLLSQISNGYAAAELLQKLSEVINSEDNTGGALGIFQNIAQEIESILGPDHLDTLLAKYCVGNAYCALHEFEKAYKINRLVYDKRKKILGSLHVDTRCAHFSLGMALLGLKEYEKALCEFKLMYPLHEAALGPDHADTWNALDKTACCLEALRKHEEVLDVYKILLQKQQRVFGYLN